MNCNTCDKETPSTCNPNKCLPCRNAQRRALMTPYEREREDALAFAQRLDCSYWDGCTAEAANLIRKLQTELDKQRLIQEGWIRTL